MNESNEVADLYFAIPNCLLRWRWLRRKVEPDSLESSWRTLFVNLIPFSLDQKERRLPREDWDDSHYGFSVAGRTSSSGMQMSGANKNCPLRRPFLHRSDLTLVSDWKRFAGRTGIICETGEVKRSHQDIRSSNDETCRTSLCVHRSRRFHFASFDMEIISISTSNRWQCDVMFVCPEFSFWLHWFDLYHCQVFRQRSPCPCPHHREPCRYQWLSLISPRGGGGVSSRSFYLPFCSANIHRSCIDGSAYSIHWLLLLINDIFHPTVSCAWWTG